MSASAVLVTSERLNRGRWCQPIPISLAFSPHKWVCLIHISLLRRLCKRKLSYAIYLFSWIMNAQTSIQGDNYTCLKLSRLKEKFRFGPGPKRHFSFEVSRRFWTSVNLYKLIWGRLMRLLSRFFPHRGAAKTFSLLSQSIFIFPATRSVSLCHLRRWTLLWTLAWEEFLPGLAWLLLSKTGPLFSPSLYSSLSVAPFLPFKFWCAIRATMDRRKN